MVTNAGPRLLWIVRHGQSAGNVARDSAEALGEHHISIPTRDVDVDLSELGHRQATALADALTPGSPDERPEIIITSPYRRARSTADTLAARLRPYLPVICDERLREREFGILDGLTRIGIERHHPDQGMRMTSLGKFYFRPPGGESWCDLILRLRSWFDSVCREFADRRVLVVCHGAIVLCLRYILERLDEAAILAIDTEVSIANCSVTSYRRNPASSNPAGLQLEAFNAVWPVAEAGGIVTDRPDRPAGDR
jgi:2,3-bisphosphoglycerate-dependent phosphoglycerate mutase